MNNNLILDVTEFPTDSLEFKFFIIIGDAIAEYFNAMTIASCYKSEFGVDVTYIVSGWGARHDAVYSLKIVEDCHQNDTLLKEQTTSVIEGLKYMIDQFHRK